MFVCFGLLISAGLMAIYSVDYSRHLGIFSKQMMFLIMGLVPFTILWRTNPEVWRRIAPVLYVSNIAILLMVSFVGKSSKGAGRWIEVGSFQFQPSELTKLFIIITLASFFANRQAEIKLPRTFALSFLHVLPSVILIYKQPHLGATIGILAIWLLMSILAEVPWKYLAVVLVMLGSVGVVLKYKPEWLLEPYQLGRFSSDQYQVNEAKKAFGLGGLTGSGFLKGEQKKLGFIPEQHNDFIFSVVGEEGGLVACTFILGLFGTVFLRIWWSIVKANSMYLRLIAGGVLTILAYHTVVNLGMNLQLLPVVGIWLPFMSYGGTALWFCLSVAGLAMAVSRENEQMAF